MKGSALVLGGTGGIGSAVVSTLSSRGYEIVATYLRDEERARSLHADVLVELDLGNPQDIESTLERIGARLERLIAVVNCAATPLNLKRLADLSCDEIVSDVATLLTGAMIAARCALAFMEEGAIVHVLSQVTETTPARMTSYVAAKSGLRGFVQSLAAELKSTRIRSLGVSPSLVETRLIEAFPKKLIEMEKARRPGGELQKPEEVAQWIVTAIEDPVRFPNGTIAAI